MRLEQHQSDVLCVGGGIAGLMAAIRAAERGARVVVAEKANVLHSGNGGGGNDHFMCYLPEVHGNDIGPILEAMKRSHNRGMRHTDYLRTWLEMTADIVKLWDEWGIPMKYNGQWEFAGHALPGRRLMHLHYSGRDQKKILIREAQKRGVRMVNRVMVCDLLASGGSIRGALGIDTRCEKVVEFTAKSVLLATGRCVRLYPAPVPGLMFNVSFSPSCTGDGMAMAYRAGAALANLELPNRWAGPRYMARCGKATWIGVLRDPQDRPIGPFVTRPERKYGDPISDIYPTLFEQYAKSAGGPVYMDCRGISEGDYDYMMHFLRHEGLTSLLNHLDEEGVDLHKNPIEFGTYELMPTGGIYHDDKGRTSVDGLYVAGDEAYGSSSISMASTFGWLIGEAMADDARQAESTPSAEMETEIAERVGMLEAVRSRREGVGWREFNIALQQIMNDYAGANRSETLLEAGQEYLQRLRRKAGRLLMANNQHELMHGLEVLDLLDIGEGVFTAARARKESRGLHVRADYPFTNPLLEKFLLVSKRDGKPVIEWQEIRR